MSSHLEKSPKNPVVKFRLQGTLVKKLDVIAKKAFTTRAEIARRACVALVESHDKSTEAA